MKTTDYFQGFLDRLNKAGFSVFLEEKPFEAPQQVSSKKQILLGSTMSLAAGLAGLPGFQHGVGYSQQNSKETLIEDLKKLQNHCDLIGIKDNFGDCHLRLAISADDMSDESLVGRLAIIHEQVLNFQKYSMNKNYARVRPWIQKLVSGSDGGRVECNVFLVFSVHNRAKEFFEKHISKCKHGGLLKKIHTYPHVVDLEEEVYQSHSGKKTAIPK